MRAVRGQRGDLACAARPVAFAARTGERVYVDGPYGSFCTDRVPAPGYVFVAGGIGIAPMLSLLRTHEAPRVLLL